jgi:predicted RND superfamily exporter protein
MFELEINEATLCLEEVNRLEFNPYVADKYDDEYDNVEYEVENNSEEYQEDTLRKMKQFLEHNLTNADKIAILEKIKELYDKERYAFDYETTLFDEDRIEQAIKDWIEENFEFTI